MRSELGKEVAKGHEQDILLRFDVLSSSLDRAKKAAKSMAAVNTPKSSTFSQSVAPRLREGYLQTSIASSSHEAASTSANTDEAKVTFEPAAYIGIADTAINSIKEIDLNTSNTGVIFINDIRKQLEEIYKGIPQSARDNLKGAA